MHACSSTAMNPLFQNTPTALETRDSDSDSGTRRVPLGYFGTTIPVPHDTALVVLFRWCELCILCCTWGYECRYCLRAPQRPLYCSACLDCHVRRTASDAFIPLRATIGPSSRSRLTRRLAIRTKKVFPGTCFACSPQPRMGLEPMTF